MSGKPVVFAARAAPRQDLLFFGREVGAYPDFADQADLDLAAVDAFHRVLDDLVGNRLAAHPLNACRVRAFEVVAGPHNDIKAVRLAYPKQGFGVAANASAGGIDHRLPACFCEELQLLDRHLLVVEPAIVRVHERIHAQFTEYSRPDRSFREITTFRLCRFMPPGSGIHQKMFVHQGNAHCLDRDRSLDRHNLTTVSRGLASSLAHDQPPPFP